MARIFLYWKINIKNRQKICSIIFAFLYYNGPIANLKSRIWNIYPVELGLSLYLPI